MIGERSWQQTDTGWSAAGPGRRVRAARGNAGLSWLIWAPVATVILVSFVASLWFAWQINKNLGEFSRQQETFAREKEINTDLIARRDKLSAKENISKKAAVLGLFPPNDKQIRKIKNP